MENLYITLWQRYYTPSFIDDMTKNNLAYFFGSSFHNTSIMACFNILQCIRMLHSGILLNAGSFAEIHLNSNFVNGAMLSAV